MINTYRSNDSLVKQGIREILETEVRSHWSETPRTKRVITLSNTSFDLERTFMDKAKVICIERDKKTYNKALKTKPKQIQLIHDDIFTHNFGYKWNDFIWMDLCNSHSESLLTNVIEFIKRTRMAKNSVFAITFAKSRGWINRSTINEYYPQFKDKGIVHYLGNMFRNEIKEVKVIDYKCADLTVMAAPMSLIIFKLK